MSQRRHDHIVPGFTVYIPAQTLIIITDDASMDFPLIPEESAIATGSDLFITTEDRIFQT